MVRVVSTACEALDASADKQTLSDVADMRTVASTIRESAEHVLLVAFDDSGIAATPEQIKRIARELGNNAAMVVGMLETR